MLSGFCATGSPRRCAASRVASFVMRDDKSTADPVIRIQVETRGPTFDKPDITQAVDECASKPIGRFRTCHVRDWSGVEHKRYSGQFACALRLCAERCS